jgi:hypothetical protein
MSFLSRVKVNQPTGPFFMAGGDSRARRALDPDRRRNSSESGHQEQEKESEMRPAGDLGIA